MRSLSSPLRCLQRRRRVQITSRGTEIRPWIIRGGFTERSAIRQPHTDTLSADWEYEILLWRGFHAMNPGRPPQTPARYLSSSNGQIDEWSMKETAGNFSGYRACRKKLECKGEGGEEDGPHEQTHSKIGHTITDLLLSNTKPAGIVIFLVQERIVSNMLQSLGPRRYSGCSLSILCSAINLFSIHSSNRLSRPCSLPHLPRTGSPLMPSPWVGSS